MEEKLKRKKIILTILIIIGVILSVVAVFSIVFGIKKVKMQNEALFDDKKADVLKDKKLNEKQKKFIGINTDNKSKITYDDEENYTDSYKKYLELTDEEKKGLEVIPRKDEVPNEKIDEIGKDIEIENQIPDKFNLADKINIKVANQDSFGLCWDFAAMKTLETFLALHENKNYDFSESHVDYLTSNLLYSSFGREVHTGGNFDDFKNYLKLTGPVLEEKLPYGDYEESEYKDFIDIKPVVNVTKTVEFPESPALEENSSKTQIEEFRNLVKSHIMKNGALYATVSSGKIKLDDAGTSANQYCTDDCFVDHAVAIVGWDDNYSKENFTTENGKTPKNDGAYIALNSWGEEWGNKGYFYISYEDELVESEMSGILSTSVENNLKISSLKSTKIQNYLKEHYGHLFININNEEYLNSLVLEDVTALSLNNSDLNNADLETIVSVFPNVSSLELADNNITDISVLKNLKSIWHLDLTNNKISDISSLTGNENIISLSLGGNNIKSISTLNTLPNLDTIDLSNNPINWKESNLTKSKISYLVASNTGLSDINLLENLGNLAILEIDNNPITSLDGIQNFNLYELNISDNNIKDFSVLKKMYQSTLEEAESEDDNFELALKANNCDIEDISIFNNMKISSLELANNKIKDVSNFQNKNVYYIDLSQNQNITGLSTLKNVSSVVLSNNNITDLNEVTKLSNVQDLDLSYNNIKDYEPLKKLENLTNLSLEGNINVKIDSLPTRLESLNIQKCNLDANADLSNLKNLWLVNISYNPNFKNIKSLTENIPEDMYRNIIMEGYQLSEDELQKIEQNDSVMVSGAAVNLGYEAIGNQKITVDYGSWLNKTLMKSMLYADFSAKDIDINKNAKEMSVSGEVPQIHTGLYNIFILK